jgi:two-component system OmpR family response regulator/two-component system response regulator QseB
LRSLCRSGVPIILSAQEFRLLSVLMLRQDRFVSKAQLEAALYDHTTEVESNTVEVAIYGLRKKLGSERIINRRNIGYRIV